MTREPLVAAGGRPSTTRGQRVSPELQEEAAYEAQSRQTSRQGTEADVGHSKTFRP